MERRSGGRKIRRASHGHVVEKINDRRLCSRTFSIRACVRACTCAYTYTPGLQTLHHTPPAPRALETSPCTTGAGNRLDNTATRSRALQPTVLARISGCLRALPCSLAHNHESTRHEDAEFGARIGRGRGKRERIRHCFTGGGEGVGGLVAVSAAAIPRGGEEGEGRACYKLPIIECYMSFFEMIVGYYSNLDLNRFC